MAFSRNANEAFPRPRENKITTDPDSVLLRSRRGLSQAFNRLVTGGQTRLLVLMVLATLVFPGQPDPDR